MGAPGTPASFLRSLAINCGRAHLALTERLERDEHAPDIGRRAAPSTAAGEAADELDVGVASDNAEDLGKLSLHRLEGDVLIGLDGAADSPGVLLGKEALGDHQEEVDIRRHRNKDDKDHEPGVAQGPAERDIVVAPHPVEGILA